MTRFLGHLALAAVGLVVMPDSSVAQSLTPATLRGHAAQPVRTTDRSLQASLDRIASGSRSWRESLDAARQGGGTVIVLTPDQLPPSDARGPGAHLFSDPTVLAEVAGVLRNGSQVHAVLVVVNVSLLDAIHRNRRSLPGEKEADLDRILVHEVYGHALPYLLAGDTSGRCADPTLAERASEACSIQRENVVRAELGLGRRTDSGLASLALARRD